MVDRKYVLVKSFLSVIVLAHLSTGDGLSPPCSPLQVPYGKVTYQNHEKAASLACNPGFQMAGRPVMRCWEGSWDQATPICFSTRPGCPAIKHILNGYVKTRERGGVVVIDCDEGFEWPGSRLIFCNGTKWNETLPPVCTEKPPRLFAKQILLKSHAPLIRNASAEESAGSNGTSCSFETSSCGWIQETDTPYKWTLQNGRRPDGNPDVGPLRDASLGQTGNATGLYMFARPSTGGKVTDTARLLSPIFNGSSMDRCLSFWYYLHGIRHRPLSVLVVEFGGASGAVEIGRLSGDHGDRWRRAQIAIGNGTSERFRVIFEIKRGEPHSAEAALDEISLFNDPCETSENVSVPTQRSRTTRPDLDKNVTMTDSSENGTVIAEGTQQVNIDIYEVGNRSFVDEPSQFTIQFIHLHTATINPQKFGGSFDDLNNVSRLVERFTESRIDQSTNQQRRMYVGLAVGLIVLLLALIAAAVGFFRYCRKRRAANRAVVVKPTMTEETEFQYFSYSNDGFREAPTLSADRKAGKK
ncbi:putative MAM domain-containing glycosylphosphatidylinositol anchor protein 1 [Hypsibius exemplaris]|uniref:MAM domain-containing glycosylphosphatidylinositol anchor protein 1 n=1 Tax=Hypsibius exemplaris TaxID=2072580 RepID=A0A1W0X3D6_HYPEX|nr:putative MAM domain-containing glycosylphosphatidylinositol anchor protein 1 [Hypsibius exemplaris]